MTNVELHYFQANNVKILIFYLLQLQFLRNLLMSFFNQMEHSTISLITVVVTSE